MPGAWARSTGDIPSIAVDPEGHDWHPLQHHWAFRFGANVFVARREGAELVGEHDETGSGQEKLYVVLAGRAVFVLDGVEHEVGATDVVAVTEPAGRRTPRALVAGTSTWNSRHFAAVPKADASTRTAFAATIRPV